MNDGGAAQRDNREVRRIIVVGGGSAGWIAASRIAARNASHDGGVEVILVESSNIPSIGVGEGTWPTMRNTLRKIGISETEFVRACDATFKQGARFVGWADGTPGDTYYHPLNPPAGAAEIDLAPHWEALGIGASDFAHAVDIQAAICDAGLAPKAITDAEYIGILNYAYHLDAGKFADLLRDHAIRTLGVRHVVDDVIDVELSSDGYIEALTLRIGGRLPGDLFVDCTGFAALLIGRALGVKFRPLDHVLFNDRAIAMQVPYASADEPVACQTISTAQRAGWIWDIGLSTRRGTGYVYSGAHESDDDAEATLRRYVGPNTDHLAARLISFAPGHRESFWKKNCVAIGLSAGFIEPLEASALMLIEKSVDLLAENLPPTRDTMAVMEKEFNAGFTHHWERIVEFLKLHYVLTKRTDSDYWRDNVAEASVPTSLRERLSFWRRQPPSRHDFSHSSEVFSWPSYQYVIHGMKYPTAYAQLPRIRGETADARRYFERVERLRSLALAALPEHRRLLAQIAIGRMQII